MKKILLILIGLLFIKTGFTQVEKDSIITNSISFLDNKFHFNLEKAGEYILIFYEDHYYILDKYYKEKEADVTRVKVIYKLKKTGVDKYNFIFIWSGEIKGTFYYKEGKFDKLTYVKMTK